MAERIWNICRPGKWSRNDGRVIPHTGQFTSRRDGIHDKCVAEPGMIADDGDVQGFEEGTDMMKYGSLALLGWGLFSAAAHAQDATFVPEATQDVGYGGMYNSPASIGSGEPLFRYDDQERWKHGWIRNMPYYEGYHSFRPYNYHHVFSQAQTSAGWGMPATMPYSQQFWHRYEGMTDLSRGDHSPVAPYVPPPEQFNHYPKPLWEGHPAPSPSPVPARPETSLPLPPEPVTGQVSPSSSFPRPSYVSTEILPTQASSPQAASEPVPLQVPY